MAWFYGTLQQVNFGTTVVLLDIVWRRGMSRNLGVETRRSHTFLLYSVFVAGQEMTML